MKFMSASRQILQLQLRSRLKNNFIGDSSTR